MLFPRCPKCHGETKAHKSEHSRFHVPHSAGHLAVKAMEKVPVLAPIALGGIIAGEVWARIPGGGKKECTICGYVFTKATDEIFSNELDSAESYYKRANHRQWNDKVNAMQDIDLAIKLEPNNHRFFYLRAKLQLNKSDAVLDINHAMNLSPENETSHYYERSKHQTDLRLKVDDLRQAAVLVSKTGKGSVLDDWITKDLREAEKSLKRNVSKK